MTKLTDNRLVAYSSGQMFALVGDVEAYPEFVPHCLEVKIRASGNEDGKDIQVVDMTAGYKWLRETFSSRVVRDLDNNMIDSCLLSGPLKKMESKWLFIDNPSGCVVNYSIVYEFESRVLARVAGLLFEKFFASFADAFEVRAKQLYG